MCNTGCHSASERGSLGMRRTASADVELSAFVFARTWDLMGRRRAYGDKRGVAQAMWRLALSAGLVLVVLASTSSAAARAAEACPNEAVRVQQGEAALALPDCRAYEFVSPNGSTPYQFSPAISSVSGDRFGYFSYDPYPGTDAASLYLLSTRGAGGWTTQAVIPSQGSFKTSRSFACAASIYYSAELDRGVLVDGLRDGKGVCEGDDPPLVPGEPRDVTNLFLRNNETSAYQLLDQPLAGESPENAEFRDATPDLSDVLFTENARLTPEAPVGLDLYEWSAGEVRLVTVLPDGTPVEGTPANSGGGAAVTHAMSADGERVFFDAQGNLYARLNVGAESTTSGACSDGESGKACTVQVDAAAAGAPGPAGGGSFMDASEDGSRVYFTDENRLTADATASTGAPDLYEYDVETGELVDLTVSATEPADVKGYGGSAGDGSYLYFLASSVLTGEQANSDGAKATPGGLNLYVRHAGATTFIATLNETEGLGYSLRASANGQFFVFASTNRLTEFDNEGMAEVYLYDAGANRLSCVSCGANGARPTGGAELPRPQSEIIAGNGNVPPDYVPRSVTNEGRVFFDSSDPLVPQATNGVENVYEYENGRASLISPGSAIGGSEFLEASASGDDAFFSTAQSLVQADTDNGLSVYDARVDGGFPVVAGEGGEVPACESVEACKPPASEAPAEPFPASAAFSGPGNLTAPPAEVESLPEKPAVRALTRVQRLARALKQCARKPKRQRRSCQVRARKQFGAKADKSEIGGRR